VASFVAAICLAGCSGGGTVTPVAPPAPLNDAASLQSTTTAAPLIPPTPAPADSSHAYFVTPNFGDLNTGSTVRFSWTQAAGTGTYQLQVGSKPGGNDLYDSGLVLALEETVPNLPSGVVYAQVRAVLAGDPSVETNGEWTRGAFIAFRTDAAVQGAALNLPLATAMPGEPLSWTPDPVAISYHLQVGTRPGADDIDDSGTIYSTLRMVDFPAAATTVYVVLETRYRDRIVSASRTFTAGGPPTTAAQSLVAIGLATESVRLMANENNTPYGGTLLYAHGSLAGQGSVTCQTFAETLLALLAQMNAAVQSRALRVCLNPNGFDCHELVEVQDPSSGRWVTFDPTFGLQTLRADGAPATSEEISTATRAMAWSALKFSFLTPYGDAYARSYYLDYPLLYVYVYLPDMSGFQDPPPATLLGYYTNVGPTLSASTWGLYAAQCASGFSTVNTLWTGVAASYPCTGPDGLSAVFFAETIAPVSGDSSLAGVWTPNRYTF
jgi:hypothetical protein